MKLKAAVNRMLSMSSDAWYIFMRGVQLCVFLLLCAVALLTEWNGSLVDRYELYYIARSLNETAQSVLLLAVLFSVLIEDAST